MATPLLAVEAPQFAPAVGGILTVANVIEGGPRAGFGIAYPSSGLCGVASALPEDCFVEGEEGEKEFDGFDDIVASAFGVYRGIECFLDGTDDYTATATKALALGESYAVAQAVAANLLENDPEVVLSGSDNHPALALAAIEQYAGEVYGGVPTIHVTLYGATLLAKAGLLQRNALDGSLTTWLGSKVSADAGYATGETDTFTIWASGQVNLWRTPVVVNAGQNLTQNTSRAIAERLYAGTLECFNAKVVATTGIGE